MAYILMFLAGCACGILARAIARRKRTEKVRKLRNSVHGKSRFENSAYKNWQDEVQTDRRKPELITVKGR